MDTTLTDSAGPIAPAQKMRPKTERQALRERLVEKFAEARRLKKKEKRVRHRAKLRRSHTDG